MIYSQIFPLIKNNYDWDCIIIWMICYFWYSSTEFIESIESIESIEFIHSFIFIIILVAYGGYHSSIEDYSVKWNKSI